VGPDGLVVSFTYAPETLVIYGLVADSIVAVDVVINGQIRSARMSENGFGLRVESRPAGLEGLFLHRRDGTMNELDLRIA
jgi:hypothetical protein